MDMYMRGPSNMGEISVALNSIIREGKRLSSVAPIFDDSAHCGGYMLSLSDTMQEFAMSSGEARIADAIAWKLDHSDFMVRGSDRIEPTDCEAYYTPDFEADIVKAEALIYCEDSQQLLDMSMVETVDYYANNADLEWHNDEFWLVH